MHPTINWLKHLAILEAITSTNVFVTAEIVRYFMAKSS